MAKLAFNCRLSPAHFFRGTVCGCVKKTSRVTFDALFIAVLINNHAHATHCDVERHVTGVVQIGQKLLAAAHAKRSDCSDHVLERPSGPSQY